MHEYLLAVSHSGERGRLLHPLAFRLILVVKSILKPQFFDFDFSTSLVATTRLIVEFGELLSELK
jgi:hypothetical protein